MRDFLQLCIGIDHLKVLLRWLHFHPLRIQVFLQRLHLREPLSLHSTALILLNGLQLLITQREGLGRSCRSARCINDLLVLLIMHPEVELRLLPLILFLLHLLRRILSVCLCVAKHHFGLLLLHVSHSLKEQWLLARVNLAKLGHRISTLAAVLVDPLDKVVELKLGHVLGVPFSIDIHNLVEVAEFMAFAFEV